MKDFTIGNGTFQITRPKKKQKEKFSSFLILLLLIPFFMSAQTSVRSYFELPNPARCTSNDLDIISADLDLETCECIDGATIEAGLTLGVRNNTESLRTSFAFWAQLTVTDPTPEPGEDPISYYLIEGCEAEILPGSMYGPGTSNPDNPPRTKLANFDEYLRIYYWDGDSYELLEEGGVPETTIPYECGTSLELTNIYQAWTDASQNDSRQCPLDPSKINPKCGIIDALSVGVGLSASASTTDVSCSGESDGSIEITFSGGEEPYSIYLDDVLVESDLYETDSPYTIEDLAGSVAGTEYDWEIRDSSSPDICVKDGTETIYAPDELSLTISITDISCYGSSDGIISIDETSDDFGSYQLYKVVGDPDFDEVAGDEADMAVGDPISDPTTGFDGLGEGDYYVVGSVESSNQEGVYCTAVSDLETFTEPEELSLSISITDISCYGATDGVISIDESSDDFDSYQLYKVVGDPDYDEVEGDVADTEVGDPITDPATGFDGLGEGDYYVIGSVESGQEGVYCTAVSDLETFTEPDEFDLNISSNDVTCVGNDGTISIDGSSDNFDSYQLYKVVGDPDFDEVAGDVADTEVGDPITDSTIGFEGLGEGDYYVIGSVESSNQEGVYCTAISDLESINPALNCAHLFPTQTTCSDYLYCDKDNFVQEYLCATVKKVKGTDEITNVIPGVFFYYGDFMVEAEDVNTSIEVTIEQVVPEGYTPFDYVNDANIRIYDECDPLAMTNISFDMGPEADPGEPQIYYLTFTFTPVNEGVHVVSVKYDSKSLIGIQNPSANQSYLFGLIVDGTKEGGSYGELGINTDKTCSDPAIFDRGECNYPSSSTLQSSTQSIQAESLSLETVENDVNVSPVPFNEEITVSYDLDYTSDVTIEVFDFGGNLLKTVKDSGVSKGFSTSIGVDFSIGANQMYLLRVTTDRETFVKQIVSSKK